MANWYNEQLTNRNFLSPIGFLFTLEKAKKAAYLCQSASIPSLSLGNVDIPTRGLVPIPVEGNVQYGTFEMEFIVDEDLENYMEIHNWIYGLGYPESVEEFQNLITKEDGSKDYKEQYCDGTLAILNSNFNVSARVKFRDLYPTALSSLEFTATDQDYTYFTATATFKYLIYTIEVET